MNEILKPEWFFGMDCAKPLTLWQKIKLFFAGKKFVSDVTTYAVFKNVDGKIYYIEGGEFK